MKTLENTIDEWRPWIKIIDTWKVDETLALLPMQSKKQRLAALALAVAKWHPMRKNRGDGECGLCRFYWSECYKCDLTLAGQSCGDSRSYYHRFMYKRKQKAGMDLFWLLMDIYRKAMK